LAVNTGVLSAHQTGAARRGRVPATALLCLALAEALTALVAGRRDADRRHLGPAPADLSRMG
jgi:hypothetical protein